MAEQSVIDKVLALLEVAERGGSENERMVAAEAAQRLVLKHDLDLIEIERAGGRDPAFAEEKGEWAVTARWRIELFAAIGMSVGVHVHGNNVVGMEEVTRPVFIGRKDSIEFVRALGTSLIPWLEAECQMALDRQQARGMGVETCMRCQGYGVTVIQTAGPPPSGEYRGILASIALASSSRLGPCPVCNGHGRRPVSPAMFRESFFVAAAARIGERLILQKEAMERAEADHTALVRVEDKAKLRAHVEEKFGDMEKLPAPEVSEAGLAAGGGAAERAPLQTGRELGGQA